MPSEYKWAEKSMTGLKAPTNYLKLIDIKYKQKKMAAASISTVMKCLMVGEN